MAVGINVRVDRWLELAIVEEGDLPSESLDNGRSSVRVDHSCETVTHGGELDGVALAEAEAEGKLLALALSAVNATQRTVWPIAITVGHTLYTVSSPRTEMVNTHSSILSIEYAAIPSGVPLFLMSASSFTARCKCWV